MDELQYSQNLALSTAEDTGSFPHRFFTTVFLFLYRIAGGPLTASLPFESKELGEV